MNYCHEPKPGPYHYGGCPQDQGVILPPTKPKPCPTVLDFVGVALAHLTNAGRRARCPRGAGAERTGDEAGAAMTEIFAIVGVIVVVFSAFSAVAALACWIGDGI